MASVPLSFKVILPDGLDAMDYNRKVVMDALAEQAKDIRVLARSLLSRKGRSSEGQYPGKDSGRMMRHVKVHKAKRKDRFWARVQIDSFKDNHAWYPAPLMYGRKDGSIKPRKDAVWKSADELSDKTLSAIESALDKALKGWS